VARDSAVAACRRFRISEMEAESEREKGVIHFTLL